MANDLKLEIYKLKLSNKEDGTFTSFRKLFGQKFNNYGNKGTEIITKARIFNTFYDDFIKKIDSKGYQVNEKKKKGFTIATDNTPSGPKSHIKHSATETIISGILDGGKHGRKRSLSSVENKASQTPIGVKNIVTDRFYFLLYTPLDHNEAILMIQGYSEIKISDVFRDHLVNYFKFNKQISSKVELFVPQSLKDKYLESAVFKSIKFSSGWAIKPDIDEKITSKDYEVEIKIEIIDKSKKKVNYKKFREIISLFSKSKFKPEGGVERNLGEFDKKNATMISKTKPKAIDFQDEDNVIPTILLEEEGITVGEGGVPNFDEINLYCRELLTEIIEEVMPNHGIDDL
ncbi:MAG: hypothetical protein JNL69_11715 [Bacteroidia bacterium]|nr:hypothetical protein [Bacteroidia bacterium]